MAADAPTGILDSAWGHIPHSREATSGIGSFTRTRVERIITLVAGFGSLVLGTQAFLSALGPDEERPGWHVPLMAGVFVPLAIMILACFIGRGVRLTAGVFALVYVLALAVWPIATAGIVPVAEQPPWIWYLVNLATMAAVLAFPFPLQIVWTILAPMLFGIVRLIQGNLAPDFWVSVALDVSFALILGGVILTLGWLFRSVAANVDETRARAVSSYAQAAAADALEKERVAVAALMHDSVLAALIAAERAETPRARTLAAAMAREALTRLANTEQDAHEGPDEPRHADSLADEIEAGALEVGVELAVRRSVSADEPSVPGRVARALTLAATQAIANAVEHAGGVGLSVSVTAGGNRVDIEVSDTGEGFDLEDVPDDRLGIRASIFARVAAVGGTADIETGHRGTIVRLGWQEGVA
ncbi:sensor histidine kinase [Microbacterium sp. CFBP9034]|uniref:sensor histidine kinase n=1 Tax=Microbacterium sp. CFBP9034 TaxID=3096540 RepID=UPI002A6B55B4|nr:ATP-binding protein [Microbacterium sp. CFBP9034]MDY0908971.1 ATP-binding protein [Microbacterium sp. CFBP9034]